MRRNHVKYTIATALLGVLTSSAAAQTIPGATEVLEKAQAAGTVRVIARIAVPRNAGIAEVETAKREFEGAMTTRGAVVANQIPQTPLSVLELDAAQLAALVESGQVTQVIEDRIDEPFLTESVPLIRAPDVWAAGGRGAGKAVAILDTGVEAAHPFFNGRVVAEACFSSNAATFGATTVCPNGTDSQIGPGAGEPCSFGSCDHGTHVAGIAAGRQSDSFSGVAPDADIVAIQVFSRFDDVPGDPNKQNCSNSARPSPCALTFLSDQIRGLQQVLSLKATIDIVAANMSLGGGRFTTACDTDVRKQSVDQLRNAGVAVVIASGNNAFSDAVGSPGCISTAVTVGSTRKNDLISGFSNSDDVVDLLAPGSSINASVTGGGFGFKSGTSMATPHVAGALAALASAKPTATLDEIEQALKSTGQPISHPVSGLTRPRIDVMAALDQLNGTAPSPTPGRWSDAFGHDDGWRIGDHPRMLADANGDGKKDVVGFGPGGVDVALSTGSAFDTPQRWIDGFGTNAGGWRGNRHPRTMADVNGDGRADIVGFGEAGVFVALSNGAGFDPASLWSSRFGYATAAGSWRIDRHPRFLADVTGDGRADVVGFGDWGVSVAVSTGSSFAAPRRWTWSFGRRSGGWTQAYYPRLMADVNDDGRADIVGFGYSGTYVALSTGSGFATTRRWSRRFGYGRYAGGWRTTRHPRLMADVSGDGSADIIGFGEAGVLVATSQGFSFGPETLWSGEFGASAGWSVIGTPRLTGMTDTDQRADVVGFSAAGVRVARSNGAGLDAATTADPGFGSDSGWRSDRHPRMLGDVTGDGTDDVVGFFDDGVHVAVMD